MKMLIFTFWIMSLTATAIAAESRQFIDTTRNLAFAGQSRETTKGYGIFVRESNPSTVESRMSTDVAQTNQIRTAESDPNCPKNNISCLNISDGRNQLENLDSDLNVCSCLEERFNIKVASPTELTGEALAERERKINEGKLMASLVHFEKMFAR